MIYDTEQQVSKEALITKAKKLIADHNTQQTSSNNTADTFYQRITKKPHALNISASERVKLIQYGNKCLNEKNIQHAKQIFTAIGYNDGLERIARYYAENGNMIEAYLLFKQSGAKEKEVLEQRIVHTLKAFLS